MANKETRPTEPCSPFTPVLLLVGFRVWSNVIRYYLDVQVSQGKGDIFNTGELDLHW